MYFNPRSPHGERRRLEKIVRESSCISIHAPRTGSDFLSIAQYLCYLISIHAPRTGSDQVYNSTFRCYCISIHAPRTGSDNM